MQLTGKQPRLIVSKEKILVGLSLEMTFNENRTGEVWQSFMRRRKEITNGLTGDLISMQVYPPEFDFHPNTAFVKWATAEVSDLNNIPAGMAGFILETGLYAVFLHKGSSTDTSIFQYIFGTWLPESDFVLDSRPHFEILGTKYRNNDQDSEEEIWIPIKPRLESFR